MVANLPSLPLYLCPIPSIQSIYSRKGVNKTLNKHHSNWVSGTHRSFDAMCFGEKLQIFLIRWKTDEHRLLRYYLNKHRLLWGNIGSVQISYDSLLANQYFECQLLIELTFVFIFTRKYRYEQTWFWQKQHSGEWHFKSIFNAI